MNADPARLEQVVVNLLMNAAKYTEEGGTIWLTAAEENGNIVMRVKDTGIGIAPEVLPKIFDLFSQADRSLARSKGGLGIGLTVAKRLAELHGSTIEAHSDGVGKGAEFELRWPRAKIPLLFQFGRLAQMRCRPPNLRILLVDDHADTLDGTAQLLRGYGCTVCTCSDGKDVVDAALKFSPELILLDIGLPGLDGYQVAQALRRQARFRDTILIAVSGYSQEKDRNASKESGFNLHLVKPLDVSILFNALTPLISAQPRPVYSAA